MSINGLQTAVLEAGGHIESRCLIQDLPNFTPVYTFTREALEKMLAITRASWLPQHKCGLHLSHNEHRDVYETIEQFYEPRDFVSDDEWLKAVAEDSVWSLHWYPETPIGFYRICASSLDAIQKALEANEFA